MGSEIIYGCIEDDFSITFEQGPNCEYTDTCINWDPESEHYKMVEVTIDTASCNDTYYGCINWDTRKFQVTVPDYCCNYCSECYGSPSEQPNEVAFSVTCVQEEDPCYGDGNCPPVFGPPCCNSGISYGTLYVDPQNPCVYSGVTTPDFVCGDCDEGAEDLTIQIHPTGSKQKIGAWDWVEYNPGCSTEGFFELWGGLSECRYVGVRWDWG